MCVGGGNGDDKCRKLRNYITKLKTSAIWEIPSE